MLTSERRRTDRQTDVIGTTIANWLRAKNDFHIEDIEETNIPCEDD